MKVNYGEKREIDLRDLCLKLEQVGHITYQN